MDGTRIAFLSTYYNMDMTQDEKFTTLCTALEAFHRETIGGEFYSLNKLMSIINHTLKSNGLIITVAKKIEILYLIV